MQVLHETHETVDNFLKHRRIKQVTRSLSFREIERKLVEFKEDARFKTLHLHARYATSGDKSIRNVHYLKWEFLNNKLGCRKLSASRT